MSTKFTPGQMAILLPRSWSDWKACFHGTPVRVYSWSSDTYRVEDVTSPYAPMFFVKADELDLPTLAEVTAFPEWFDTCPAPNKTACECGSNAVGSQFHSHYCPLFTTY